MRMSALVLLFLALPFAPAGEPKKTLSELAWFVGQWRSPAGEKLLAEEHWSAPAGGAMIGMFRLVSDGKPVIYEFLLLEAEADGVTMRLRHYRSRMVDVDKEPIRLKLVEATAGKAVFENPDNDKPKRITYTLAKPDRMAVVVETTRDGKAVKFPLTMDRVAGK